MPDQNESKHESKYAPTTWGSDLGRCVELEVPSGQKCLAKKPGVQGLMRDGLLHEGDPFIGLVQQHKDRVQGKQAKKASAKASEDIAKQVFENPQMLENLFHLMDRVVCHVVAEPVVKMAPNDITNRQEGVIYSDMIELEDKMFIFMWAMGGASDLATFRDELQGTMASLESK